MPWDTRIFDITHDYYNRIFEDSRDDGNMTAAFQNILMGNSLTDEQTDTLRGSGFNNGCYNVLSIDTEATDDFMYILQKVCNNTDLVFHAFVYDGSPTVILRCPSSGSIADKCSDIAEQLGGVIEYDKTHHSALTDTLYEYLKCSGSVQHISEKMFCHRNMISPMRRSDSSSWLHISSERYEKYNSLQLYLLHKMCIHRCKYNRKYSRNCNRQTAHGSLNLADLHRLGSSDGMG